MIEINQTLDMFKEERKDLSKVKLSAILKTLYHIKKDWDLSYEKLGKYIHISKSSTERWIKAENVSSVNPSDDEVELMVNFIAIYKSLNQIFSDKENQLTWINSPHPIFNNSKPSDLIIQKIEGLIIVRRYLDYTRGRGA